MWNVCKILFKFNSIILSSRSVNSQNARYNRALKFKTRSKIAAFTLKTVRVKRKKTSSSLSDRMEEPDLTKISLLLQIAREAKSPTRQNLDSRYHPSLQYPPCQHEKIINRDKREAKKKPQGGGSGEIIGVFTQRPRVGLGSSNRSRCSLFISSFFSSASLTLRRGQQAVSSAASLDTEVWMNARNNWERESALMRILNYDPMNARVGIMLLDVIEGEREREGSRDTKKREVEGRKERGDLVSPRWSFTTRGVSRHLRRIFI